MRVTAVDEAGSDPAASGAAHTFPDGLVCGAHSPLMNLRRTCLRIAATPATALLTGETGTGKEVFARLLHVHSPRGKRPFVPVNCGAIPEALLESELFGYVKGAFTGAIHPRQGRVGLAEGGTLFLDEVGELPLALQVKLLRLLQERTYEPVGSSDSVTADFRLVAATNRDLLKEVQAGRFRQDLYYRLNVCPIHLPPLRERRGDIVPLFHFFWQARGEQRKVAADVLDRLEVYDWPGNVRELENVVERLSVIAEGNTIHLRDLPQPLSHEVDARYEISGLMEAERPRPVALPPLAAATPSPDPLSPSESNAVTQVGPAPTAPEVTPPPTSVGEGEHHPLELPVSLPTLLRRLEDAYIAKALAHSGGNKKEAARLLGLGRTTLVEKLRRRNSDTSAA
jgi:sigma-54 specific flagellar transcriptional regulator A